MYKAIIFDFFDVIHSDPFHRWLKKHDYDRKGEFHESSQMLDRGDISDQEFYRRLAELSGHSPESVQAVFDQTDLVDKDLVKLIESLHGRYKLGLLSNSSGSYLRPILDKYGLIGLFDEIGISAEVGLIKPDPEIFEHMLGRLNVVANETIFIDDNPHNVAAAEALGIHGIIYKTEQALRKDLAAAGVKVGVVS